MIKGLLSRIGIGGARVETVLDHDEAEPGGTLSGEVRVTGGPVAQDIRGVTIELVTRARIETRGGETVHGEILVGAADLALGGVGAGESRTLPFRIRVPAGAPLTVGSTRTALRTRLDVAGAVDPRDSDPVAIRPTRTQAAILQGIERAGFRLVETEVEHQPRRDPPFVQEFDFRPARGGDWGIEEVEVAFAPVAGGVEVRLTVDRRGGVFFGGERAARFVVTDAEAARADLGRELRRAIDSLR